MRLLVTGGRDYRDVRFLETVLAYMHAETPITLLIYGAAKGADELASSWAIRNGIPVYAFPPDWKAHGKAAGPIRNLEMLTEGKPDLVLAFDGGRGTEDMVRQARAAGVEVVMATDRARPLKGGEVTWTGP